MEPVYTLAGASDADLLIDLMREFYALEHIRFEEPAARRALRQLFDNPSFGTAHVIGVGDAAAGYVVLTFGFSLEFRGRYAFVDELYLRESYRGTGVGKKSLEFVEALCRSEGIEAVRLEVERQNERARALYRRAGYREHDRHLMTKWLKAG